MIYYSWPARFHDQLVDHECRICFRGKQKLHCRPNKPRVQNTSENPLQLIIYYNSSMNILERFSPYFYESGERCHQVMLC
jgi:hypothetical protein